MKKNTILIGVDSGFASIGYCALSFPPDMASTAIRCEAFGVFCTQKSDKKQHVLATEDNLRRAREVAAFYEGLFARFVSDERNLVAGACVESMSWPRNASSSAKMGIAYGVLAAVAARHRVPIFQASPQAIKKKVAGRKDASKLDVEAAVRARVTHVNRAALTNGETVGAGSFDALADAILKTKREHCFDAAAAVLACCDAEAVQFVRRAAA